MSNPPASPVESASPARAGTSSPRSASSSSRDADRPRRGQLPAQLRFTVGALVALVLLVATYVAFVTTDVGQRAENLALRGVELRSPAERDAAIDRLSQVTVAGFALAIVAVFMTGLLRRRGGLGSIAAVTMIASVVAAEVLKDALPRPELAPGPGWLLRNSFPSGSAAVATSFAVGAFLVAPPRLRWLVLVAGATYAAVVGEAVQTSGWHRFSDSIGATLLVMTIALLALALFARVGLVDRSGAGRLDPRVVKALTLVSLAALLPGAVLLLLPAIFPVLSAPVGARRAFLQAAFPLIGVGVTVLALTLFARVVEPYSLGRSESRGPEGRQDAPETGGPGAGHVTDL